METIATFLTIFGAHMNIVLFIIKVKTIMLTVHSRLINIFEYLVQYLISRCSLGVALGCTPNHMQPKIYGSSKDK